jgi:hypothetical protein
MAYTDVRDAVVALVDGVANTGTVHGRERWADDWPTFLGMFKANISGSDEIRGFMVSRESVVDDLNEDRMGAVGHKHSFVIRGVVGFDDSRDTETTFQTLVDSILAALDADKDLSGNAVSGGQGPAEARILDLRTFGRVLCHYVEILFVVTTVDAF